MRNSRRLCVFAVVCAALTLAGCHGIASELCRIRLEVRLSDEAAVPGLRGFTVQASETGFGFARTGSYASWYAQRRPGPGAGSFGRTVGPELEMSVASVEFSGTGPGGAVFSFTTEEDSVYAAGIRPGVWAVRAIGRNAAGTEVVRGEASLEAVPFQENGCEIVLRPLDGTGSLQIAVSWEDGALYRPEVTGSLLPVTGDPLTPVFTVDGAAAAASVPQLDAGYYLLTVGVFDGGSRVGGFTEIVRILAEYPTLVSVSLAYDTSEISISLGCRVELDNPIPLVIDGPTYTVVAGDSLSFACVVPADTGVQSPCPVSWYLNGEPYAETDGSLVLDTAEFPRFNRLDAAVFSRTGTRSGSASFEFTVEKPEPIGELCFRMAFVDGKNKINGLSGCRDVAVSHDRRLVFAAGYDDNGIALFKGEPDSPALHWIECIRGTEEVPLTGVNALALSLDGATLFAVAGGRDTVSVFSLTGEQGSFLPRSAVYGPGLPENGLAGISGLAVSPCGTVLYVTASSSVAAFSYSPETGILEPLQTITEEDVPGGVLNGVRSPVISPDGGMLAVSCSASDSVVIFERDRSSSLLRPTQVLTDGKDGVTPLNEPEGLCFSECGTCLYTTGYYDNAVGFFRYDGTAGAFVQAAEYRDGSGGVYGLRYAKDVIVSPDGTELYAVGSSSDALAVFSRDTATGSLSFVGSFLNGHGRIVSLDSPRKLAIGPDGRVYVAAAGTNALCVFDRR
jgi:6-phosphogluconolactonase (cycloisomerase 2 family)